MKKQRKKINEEAKLSGENMRLLIEGSGFQSRSLRCFILSLIFRAFIFLLLFSLFFAVLRAVYFYSVSIVIFSKCYYLKIIVCSCTNFKPKLGTVYE